MKKILFVLMIILLTTAAVFAENVVTVTNETGYTINYIYFSPSDYDDWDDDFLGDDSLEDGETVEIVLDREIDEDQFIYDLQAVDEDNDYYTMYEVDLNESMDISLTMDAYDGGDYEDYGDYDYSGYEEGYNEGYSEGYKQGYTDAFRDAYLEGFRAAADMDFPAGISSGSGSSDGTNSWR
ncbi:MAG: hypothetical protein PQJ61_10230 [Spirochaetales bacterium]|uniref:Uncharacterized protein n=1 Tax=Candidatus Thalassospirochaeta sargassi TaxID=3119039 RepID=A0AAJ1IFL9_9SPIO|nr:hypothetical protein [Spirochaetales bacterium]